MINEIYKALKERLSGIEGVKHLDWFNDQYNGIIHAEPGIFIEFSGNMNAETLSGQTQRIDVRVTIHVYSKILAKDDRSLLQEKVDEHFEIVKEVYKRLQGWRKGIDERTILFNSMQRVSLQNHQYMQGWFVTTQDFVADAYELEEKQTTDRPTGNFKIETV